LEPLQFIDVDGNGVDANSRLGHVNIKLVPVVG
jgi:hypothetical protein